MTEPLRGPAAQIQSVRRHHGISMTPSESYVARLCAKTFLSPWSITRPRGKEAGKELCDVLIVCDPDVIIISVKEVAYKATEDAHTGMQRWLSRAVAGSVKQIAGAERLLARLDRVSTHDGHDWLPLPPMERRRTHRLAVALGSKGEIPIADGTPGQPFVHVFEETALDIVLTELDTITDFVEFLRRTEEFLESTQLIVPGIENLLGLYLQRGRNYPRGADLLILDDDIWAGVSSRLEFQARKKADEASYFWDALIEHVAREEDQSLTESHGGPEDGSSPAERVTRIMAREDRFSRRLLSNAFREFHQGRTSRARMLQSPSGVVYVFLALSHGSDRILRRNELMGRMFIARGSFPTSTVVVGLATEEYDPSKGFSIDTGAYIKPTWTEEDQAQMQAMKEETGAFRNPHYSNTYESEYPNADGA